jgi:hypothetical protein
MAAVLGDGEVGRDGEGYRRPRRGGRAPGVDVTARHCSCDRIGHQCTYFEQELRCGCDGLYHCDPLPGLPPCADSSIDNLTCDGGL